MVERKKSEPVHTGPRSFKLDPKACSEAIRAYAKEHPEHADIIGRYIMVTDREINRA